jgi:hypothetical protein
MIDILSKSYNKILEELRDLTSVEERKRYLGLIHSEFHKCSVKDSIIAIKRVYKDSGDDFETVLKLVWLTRNNHKITTWIPYFRSLINKVKSGEVK